MHFHFGIHSLRQAKPSKAKGVQSYTDGTFAQLTLFAGLGNRNLRKISFSSTEEIGKFSPFCDVAHSETKNVNGWCPALSTLIASNPTAYENLGTHDDDDMISKENTILIIPALNICLCNISREFFLFFSPLSLFHFPVWVKITKIFLCMLNSQNHFSFRCLEINGTRYVERERRRSKKKENKFT